MYGNTGIDRLVHRLNQSADAITVPTFYDVETPPVAPVDFARACGLEPDPWQSSVLNSTADNQLLLAARQSGKSTTTGVIALHEAMYNAGALVLIASPSQKQSSELHRKVRDLYTRADIENKPGIVQWSALHVEFDNGSRVVALPGSESSARGYSAATLLVLDEAARIVDDLFVAIRPTTATTQGRTIALTTPFGRRGWFYEQFFQGGDDWERTSVPVSQCPRIDPVWLARERRIIGELRYRQEFELEWLADDSAVFASDLIEAAFSTKVAPLWTTPTLRVA